MYITEAKQSEIHKIHIIQLI